MHTQRTSMADDSTGGIRGDRLRGRKLVAGWVVGLAAGWLALALFVVLLLRLFR
jgi:hypothetical protein